MDASPNHRSVGYKKETNFFKLFNWFVYQYRAQVNCHISNINHLNLFVWFSALFPPPHCPTQHIFMCIHIYIITYTIWYINIYIYILLNQHNTQIQPKPQQKSRKRCVLRLCVRLSSWCGSGSLLLPNRLPPPVIPVHHCVCVCVVFYYTHRSTSPLRSYLSLCVCMCVWWTSLRISPPPPSICGSTAGKIIIGWYISNDNTYIYIEFDF